MSQPFCFLDLPAEVRNEIYRIDVVGGVQSTLAPPPLLQVCRQVRFEALPMFYAKNEFHINLRPLPALKPTPSTTDEAARDAHHPDAIAKQKAGFLWIPSCSVLDYKLDKSGAYYMNNYANLWREEDWEKIRGMFTCMSANGCLKYVTRLTTVYLSPFRDHWRGTQFGYRFNAGDGGGFQYLPRPGLNFRIGNDELDWRNYEAVSAAFIKGRGYEGEKNSFGQGPDTTEPIPIQSVAEILVPIAQCLENANKHVEWVWFCG